MDTDRTFYNEETKIWYGPNTEPKFGLDDSIGSVVMKFMLEYPDHIIQVCHQSGKQFTNKEMAEMSTRAAVQFRKLKMEQTDVVGICAGNSDYIAPIFYGVLFSGLCLSSSDPSFNVKGLKHVYSLTKPKIIFCDGEVYSKVRQALRDCELEETIIYTVRNHIDGVPSVMEFLDVSIGDEEYRISPLKHGGLQDAFYVCTSGTTDLPKVLRMSHYAILNRMQCNDRRKGQKLLVFSGVYWFLGIATLIEAVMNCETRFISEKPFSPEDFFEIVKLHKISVVASSPSHIPLCLACPSEMWLNSDLSGLRLLLTTGKTLPYSLFAKFQKYAPNCRFPVVYGMTELCGSVTRAFIDPSNSVGVLMSNNEMKILNENGEKLGPNETGEIYVRSKFTSSGYLCNPEAARRTFLQDGWIRTGDMGYFNDKGRLFIVDRRQDILKYNNFHFSPSAIEKVIYEIPEVAEVCVIGIPDVTFDFLPAAAVIKRYGDNITEAEICKYVTDRMQHFENLHGGVYFLESLPLTGSGKIIRKEVTEICMKLRSLNLTAIPNSQRDVQKLFTNLPQQRSLSVRSTQIR
ncbi:probable 4-coumarate--CoA ligase 1 [Musca autumnalis]|uniref:probable 4-coumarate--CoA ligase 1 n=1 Tax=Musca autumnalis TaxID=221902 RepID=UPI003CEDDB8F